MKRVRRSRGECGLGGLTYTRCECRTSLQDDEVTLDARWRRVLSRCWESTTTTPAKSWNARMPADHSFSSHRRQLDDLLADWIVYRLRPSVHGFAVFAVVVESLWKSPVPRGASPMSPPIKRMCATTCQSGERLGSARRKRMDGVVCPIRTNGWRKNAARPRTTGGSRRSIKVNVE